MKKTFKILTIIGSPHDVKSNTRALIEDFVEEISQKGLELEHEIISLGRKKIDPCRGCWNCTYERPCPINDDLTELKSKMIDCDMLILGSPVYTNQVTAQMKAFFDRLFTWCHIYPLLGKYSLSAVTTGNDGQKETAAFLEKMLATYGTMSFGSIKSMGAFTSGFFPWRNEARKKNKKLAQKVANTILEKKIPPPRKIQRSIFKVMKNKMSGIHTINCMKYGVPAGQPNPLKAKVKLINYLFRKMNISDKQIEKMAGYLPFELSWWRDRNWLGAKSLKQIMNQPVPNEFDVKKRLLQL